MHMQRTRSQFNHNHAYAAYPDSLRLLSPFKLPEFSTAMLFSSGI